MDRRQSTQVDGTASLHFEKIYFFLIVISLVLVAWQYWGMNRVFDVLSEDSHVFLDSDLVSGGRSVPRLSHTEEGARLNCSIKPSTITFAFCSMGILLGDGANETVDVSDFDSLELWLEHDSSLHDTVLIYLVNREPDSADKGPASAREKRNMQTILPLSGGGYYRLALDRFIVPSWWILSHKAHGKAAQPALDNITSLNLVTGDSREQRTVQMLLKKAQFSGKWIAAETLYLLLVLMFGVVLTVHGGYRIYQLANQLQINRKQNLKLEELNHFLSIQNSEYEVLAKTDVLTGVSNRAGTRDLLQLMQDNPHVVYSLIMFDIDHFKEINDTYGHEVGDVVLQNLTALVKSLIRDSDHLARWGGEEFIVLCSGTRFNNALALANNLREKIEKATLCEQSAITCSFGLSEYRKDGNDTIKKLFQSADAAMYKAKEAGRNRVEPQTKS